MRQVSLFPRETTRTTPKFRRCGACVSLHGRRCFRARDAPPVDDAVAAHDAAADDLALELHVLEEEEEENGEVRERGVNNGVGKRALPSQQDGEQLHVTEPQPEDCRAFTTAVSTDECFQGGEHSEH